MLCVSEGANGERYTKLHRTKRSVDLLDQLLASQSAGLSSVVDC